MDTSQNNSASEQNAQSTDAQEQGAHTEPHEAEKTFTQKDIDAAVLAAKEEWKSGLKDKLEKAKSQGEKLAKMTADERKAEEDRIEREKFEREKAEFERKSLISELKSQLADKGLPTAFAPMIAREDAQSSKKAFEIFEEEWAKALNAAVEKRLGGKTPNIGAAAASETESGFFDIIRKNQRI
ncbi:MAG: DUF4355 domain-containing protein [Clostridiales bacterium]|nr:DUF4355 domain-containing protein [Clostridiales bacterium]